VTKNSCLTRNLCGRYQLNSDVAMCFYANEHANEHLSIYTEI